MGVLVVSSSFSVVFEDEQVDSPISSSFSPEFEDERITGRGSKGKWAAGEEQMVESGKVWLQNDGEGLQNGGKMWAGGAFCVDLEDLQK